MYKTTYDVQNCAAKVLTASMAYPESEVEKGGLEALLNTRYCNSIEQGETPLLIDMPKEGEFVEVGVSFTQENSVVPLTVGPKQRPPGEVSKVCENESNS